MPIRPKDYSFIILTYNEEIHLPRLLSSLHELGADIFILDSGSTDRTLQIAADYGAVVGKHAFINHPLQWDYALNHFEVTTPWIIGLDADQQLTEPLVNRLQQFRDEDMPAEVDGIYFNRHNYFKGKRIRYGGYTNKYLLKMIRTGVGYSDLNENMDHRFIVPGKAMVWKDAVLKEENLKENDINFWLQKHLKYSDLVAKEELERKYQQRQQTIKPRFFGSPDERIAFYKALWWRLPLYTRPFIYFAYRFIFKRGFLDSKEGRIFHFLQGFWFRMIVDIKMDDLEKNAERLPDQSRPALMDRQPTTMYEG